MEADCKLRADGVVGPSQVQGNPEVRGFKGRVGRAGRHDSSKSSQITGYRAASEVGAKAGQLTLRKGCSENLILPSSSTEWSSAPSGRSKSAPRATSVAHRRRHRLKQPNYQRSRSMPCACNVWRAACMDVRQFLGCKPLSDSACLRCRYVHAGRLHGVCQRVAWQEGMRLSTGAGGVWGRVEGGRVRGQSPAAILPERSLMFTEAAPLLLILRSISVAFTAAACILGNACISCIVFKL